MSKNILEFSYQEVKNIASTGIDFFNEIKKVFPSCLFHDIKLPLKNEVKQIKSGDIDKMKKLFESEEIIELHSPDERFTYFINHFYGFTYVIFGVNDKKPVKNKFISLLREAILILKPSNCIGHNQVHQHALISDNKHYGKLGLDLLDIEFNGLFWLNYFSPEKMQQLGGKALFDLPYATKIEEMNNGILIQIGESPEEAMTPEGEERLFKATEWVHQLIQSQGN